MNSCMFHFHKDDNKYMLEWNQEDTLYVSKNIVYLILIGMEVWG